MQKIRDAIDYLFQQYWVSRHTLLGYDFFTDGKDLFVKKILETVNLSKKGQLAFKDLVDNHLDRLVKDNSGMAYANLSGPSQGCFSKAYRDCPKCCRAPSDHTTQGYPSGGAIESKASGRACATETRGRLRTK